MNKAELKRLKFADRIYFLLARCKSIDSLTLDMDISGRQNELELLKRGLRGADVEHLMCTSVNFADSNIVWVP